MILTRDGKEVTAIYRQDGSEIEEVKDANGRLVYLASREITGTLPLPFSGRGKPLSDYLISGNTVQDGTPTPDAPVDVVGCGVRTENVMPAGEKKTVEVNGVTFSSDGNGRYHISGTASQDTKVNFNLVSGFTIPVSVLKGGQGTLSFFNDKEYSTVRFVFCNGSTEIDDWGLLPKNRINTEYNLLGNKYVDSIRIIVKEGTKVNMTIMPEFTDDGILPSEFEPYGYKLPLTVNGTEYPIYLGQVETTRRIKKLVLDGTEPTWQEWNNLNLFRVPDTPLDYRWQKGGAICDSLPLVARNNLTTNTFCWSAETIGELIININNYNLAELKSYLSSNPVTVWYVLAEPETGIVSEPLMKVGDYADTISFAQAGVTIQTVNGANVLDTTSTVKPSEVYIKGKGIKPTGNGG